MRPIVTKAYFKHAPIVQEVEQELYEDVDILVMKGRPSMKRLYERHTYIIIIASTIEA